MKSSESAQAAIADIDNAVGALLADTTDATWARLGQDPDDWIGDWTSEMGYQARATKREAVRVLDILIQKLPRGISQGIGEATRGQS